MKLLQIQIRDPPFPGSLAGSHLLSSDKLADGLPNYRQQKRFKREQAIIPRSTQCDWIIASSLTLMPLYELLIPRVLSSKIVKTDDTWVKVQDRSLPDNIRKGKMPPYLGDKTNPFTVFDYSPTLSFDRNKEFLKSFTGFVQADASNGFDALFKDGTKVEVGCSAHPRRKADEAKDAEPKDCEEILDIYTKLYKIEEKIKGKEPEVRLLERQTKSKPLVLTLREKLLVLQKSLNPTNPLREYVDYTLKHWIALTRFVDDPDFDIGRVNDRRGGSRFGECLFPAAFALIAGVSIHSIAPFPVAARQTGHAHFAHPAFTCIIKPSLSAGRHAYAAV